LEPISIGPSLATTDALLAADVERNVSNHLARLRPARSCLDRKTKPVVDVEESGPAAVRTKVFSLAHNLQNSALPVPLI
jgi:hypothetical protein